MSENDLSDLMVESIAFDVQDAVGISVGAWRDKLVESEGWGEVNIDISIAFGLAFSAADLLFEGVSVGDKRLLAQKYIAVLNDFARRDLEDNH